MTSNPLLTTIDQRPTALIYDKWISGLGGGEVVACTLATILRDEGYQVTMVSDTKVTLSEIKQKLSLDLTGITLESSNQQPVTSNHQPDLFINISFMDYSYGIGKRNIYYVHFPSKIRTGLFNIVLLGFAWLKQTIPHLFTPTTNDQRPTTILDKLIERINDRLRAGVFPDMQKRLDSYETFICHSEYVKGWVKAMWNKDAIVIYPPVKLLTTNDQRLTTKKPWIVSIGRFFTLGHGKKQEVLIEAFKKLYDQQPSSANDKPETSNQKPATSSLELHLIGGVGIEPSSLRYIEQLKDMAKGYPIYFHFNAKREEVEQLLLQSKIYWHAGGYGETEPINFEHFGIAPVEAISAGCIPVLFDGGGLAEIIEVLQLDKKRHLFQNIHELIENTVSLLINDYTPIQLKEKCEKHFSISTFKKSFLHLLSNV